MNHCTSSSPCFRWTCVSELHLFGCSTWLSWGSLGSLWRATLGCQGRRMSGQRVDAKVVMLGKEYVGKTSLVERYVHNRFLVGPYQNVSFVPFFCAESFSAQLDWILRNSSHFFPQISLSSDSQAWFYFNVISNIWSILADIFSDAELVLIDIQIRNCLGNPRANG